MNGQANRAKRTVPFGRDLRSRRRPLAVLCAAVALLPALTTEAAFQDMTSLLEGRQSAARWQATFVPSPAGAIEKARLVFADPAERSRLPRGAGVRSGDDLYTMDTVREVFETPDEARVNRRDKGSRVVSSTAIAPPKAFSAGSILERQSLMSPADLGASEPRTAFAPTLAGDKAIEVAMTFEPARRPGEVAPGATPDRVMVASLAPASGKGARPRQTPAAGPEAAAPAPVAALGYAPSEPAPNALSSLFGRILDPRHEAPAGFVPPIGKDDHAWAATPLPPSATTAKEQACLATGIYFEARGESAEGQAAVAQVILNRVRNPTYPKTICGVVYQNKSWRNRCQFSFACDGIKDRILNKRAYARAKVIADQVTRGETWIAEVGSSTHYHARYVHPRWANAMKEVDKIGRHIFYRTYGGGWN